VTVTVELTLSAAQLSVDDDSGIGDAREQCVEYCREAGKNGSDLLVLPEMCFQPYYSAFVTSKDDLPGNLPEVSDDLFQPFETVAEKYELVLIVPLLARDRRNDGIFSSAAVIDADGSLKGIYHRVHGNSSEKVNETWLDLGDDLPVYETEAGTIGIMLGHDRHFPEQSRILGVNGADVICVPSGAYGDHHDTWELELRAHTVAHGLFVVGANRTGSAGNLDFFGESMIIDPRGQISGELGSEDSVLTESVDTDEIREVRDLWQFFRDRRPETYSRMVDE
jgi:N-carbamoylputrescine amidase